MTPGDLSFGTGPIGPVPKDRTGQPGRVSEQERLRRWRLALGGGPADGTGAELRGDGGHQLDVEPGLLLEERHDLVEQLLVLGVVDDQVGRVEDAARAQRGNEGGGRDDGEHDSEHDASGDLSARSGGHR